MTQFVKQLTLERQRNKVATFSDGLFLDEALQSEMLSMQGKSDEKSNNPKTDPKNYENLNVVYFLDLPEQLFPLGSNQWQSLARYYSKNLLFL